MCGIGERTGHLEDVMQGLSAYYERESRIRQAVRSAVTYPLVLSVMMEMCIRDRFRTCRRICSGG